MITMIILYFSFTFRKRILKQHLSTQYLIRYWLYICYYLYLKASFGSFPIFELFNGQSEFFLLAVKTAEYLSSRKTSCFTLPPISLVLILIFHSRSTKSRAVKYSSQEGSNLRKSNITSQIIYD